MQQLHDDRWLFWVSLGAFLAVLLIASMAHAEENDVAIALHVARAYQLTPFQTRVLLCTRVVENGRPGREYGVLHPKAIGRSHAVQARWAAGTIKRRLYGSRNAGTNPARRLETFAARWAPIGVVNDPQDLNRTWLDNMEACLAQLEP